MAYIHALIDTCMDYGVMKVVIVVIVLQAGWSNDFTLCNCAIGLSI